MSQAHRTLEKKKIMMFLLMASDSSAAATGLLQALSSINQQSHWKHSRDCRGLYLISTSHMQMLMSAFFSLHSSCAHVPLDERREFAMHF